MEDLYPADPTRGTYLPTPGWLKIDIRAFAFERSSTIQVDVLHGFVASVQPQELLLAYSLFSPTAWPPELPIGTVSHISLRVGQSEPPFSLFTSDELPSAIDFTQADILNGEVITGTDELTTYGFQFALRAAPVPEPATFVLASVGLLFFLTCSWHVRRVAFRKQNSI